MRNATKRRLINLARHFNTFDFIGKFKFFNEGFKIDNYPSGWNKKSLKASINESQNNGIWLTLDGMWYGQYEEDIESTVIKVKSKKVLGQDGFNMEIPWSDRMDESILSKVSDMRKIIVDIGQDDKAFEKLENISREIFFLETKQLEKVEEGDDDKLEKLYEDYAEAKKEAGRLEFLHAIDVINFFAENKGKFDEEMFQVKGNVDISHSKGKFYVNYKPTHFTFLGHKEDVKPKLSALLDLYFTDNLVDDSQYEKKRLIRYKTYIANYDGGWKADKMFPLETVFNGAKYDPENPNHVAHENIIKTFMQNAEKDKVNHLLFECTLISGAEEKEFTEADLTDQQKMMVSAGLNKVEDFKKKTYGDRYEEVRLRIPVLKNMEDKGDFSKGATLANGYKKSDLNYVPPADKNAPAQTSQPADTAKEEPKQENKTVTFNEDDLPF